MPAHATGSGSSTTSRTGSSGSRSATSTRCPPPRSSSPAHRDLEKLVSTIHQNNFKRALEDRWAYLCYAGLWHEPLRTDLDAYMDAGERAGHGRGHAEALQGLGHGRRANLAQRALRPGARRVRRSGGEFSQEASPGFIELFTLQSRMAYRFAIALGG